jgi:hypothetical protein
MFSGKMLEFWGWLLVVLNAAFVYLQVVVFKHPLLGLLNLAAGVWLAYNILKYRRWL